MTPTTSPSKLTYHKRRINRILDAAATRHIIITGRARLVTVPEVSEAMTDRERCDVIRSAYVLATADSV